MAQIPYTNFLSSVRPYCPNAPDPVVIDAVRNATIEFCRESLWLQSQLAPILVVAWQNEYPLLPVSQDAALAVTRLEQQLPVVTIAETEPETGIDTDNDGDIDIEPEPDQDPSPGESLATAWLEQELPTITVVQTPNVWTPDTEIAHVRAVSFNGFPLRAASEQALDRLYGLDWRQQFGQPLFYTQVNDQTLRIVPTPSEPVSGVSGLPAFLHVTAALMPTRASLNCDQNLFFRWFEEITYGARARLHEMAGQSFTDFRAVQSCAARFRAGIARAVADRNASEVGGDLRVIPRRFY